MRYKWQTFLLAAWLAALKPRCASIPCHPPDSDDDGDTLSYNFVVQPATGEAYTLRNAPTRSLSAVIGLLPIGTNAIRAVAYDPRCATFARHSDLFLSRRN